MKDYADKEKQSPNPVLEAVAWCVVAQALIFLVVYLAMEVMQ